MQKKHEVTVVVQVTVPIWDNWNVADTGELMASILREWYQYRLRANETLTIKTLTGHIAPLEDN